jgi:hypothetical protein
MYTHRIAISMEDTDIERETTILLISTTESLTDVCEQLQIAFNEYDRAEGIALKYREAYGWGILGFVEYLNRIYGYWRIEEEIPDETLEFIGM